MDTNLKNTELSSVKRVLLALLIVALLCVAGVFAYLTATDEKVNELSIANALSMQVEENAWGLIRDDAGNQSIDPAKDTNSNGIPDVAENMEPGASVVKDPLIHNLSDTSGWAVAEVKVPLVNVKLQGDASASEHELYSYEANEGWTKYGAGVKSEDGKWITYTYLYDEKLGADESSSTVFDKVTLLDFGDESGLDQIQQIEVKGTLIQAEGFETPLRAHEVNIGVQPLVQSTLSVAKLNKALSTPVKNVVFTTEPVVSTTSTKDVTNESSKEINVSYSEDSLTASVGTVNGGSLVLTGNMSNFVSNLDNVETIDVSALDTSDVTDFSNAFSNLPNLREQTGLDTLDLSNVSNIEGFGKNCGIEITNDSMPLTYVMKEGQLDSIADSFGIYTIRNHSIYFTDSIAPSGATLDDLDADGDGGVVGWQDNNGDYYVSTQKEGQKVIAPSNMSKFLMSASMVSIDFSNLDFSKVTDMSSMLAHCNSLKDISGVNIDEIDFTRVDATDIFKSFIGGIEAGLFGSASDCTSIILPPMSSTTMKYLLYPYRDTLVTLDVSSVNTDNVTSLENVFDNCEQLTKIIGLENWDTSKITSMKYMFNECSSLTSLDLSSFDTSNVTNMDYMFQYCSQLNTIIVGDKWNVSNVLSSSSQFYKCSSLKGGLGTLLDSYKYDKTYAKIDGGEDSPGYLTPSINIEFKNLGVYKYNYGFVFPQLPNGYNSWGTSPQTSSSIPEFSAGDIFNAYSNVNAIHDWIFYPLYIEPISHIVFDANDGYFENHDSSTNIVSILKNGNKQTKCIHTSNLDANGSGSEVHFLNNEEINTVTIPNSDNLTVTITYGSTSGTNSSVYLYPDGANIDTINESISGALSNTYGLKTQTFTVPGDTVTIVFDVNKYESYGYGYYAVVTNNDNLVSTFGNYIEPCKYGYEFVGWSDNPNSETPDLNDWGNLESDTTLYAVWKEASVQSFAVYSETDNSLNYYKRAVALPKVGSIWNDGDGVERVVTHLFTGFEEYEYYSNYDNYIPWYSYRDNIKSVNIIDDNIKPLSIKNMFANMGNSSVPIFISGLEKLDVSDIAIFNYCFYNSSFKNLDLSAWNTSNATEMNSMFQNCSSLTSLDVSNFDTSKVWDMRYIFGGCSSLEELDISNFNTSKVTTMYNMFAYNKKLKSLNISHFDTSNISDMSGVFQNCSSLTSLDVSNFDTSKVTNMSDIFSGCSSLTSLDVSNFDTSKVTNMSGMFDECSSLKSLDLSNFDTSKVTKVSGSSWSSSLGGLFIDCNSLETIYVSNLWDMSNVTQGNYVFNNCTSLVGGNGTTYDSSKTDVSMAHVDTPDNPGYLTHISQKPEPTLLESVGDAIIDTVSSIGDFFVETFSL